MRFAAGRVRHAARSVRIPAITESEYSSCRIAMSAFVSPLVLWSLGAAAAAYALWKVLYFFVIERFTSPLRDLPSPPNPSWLYGNLQEISEAENSIRQEAWVQEYGTTLKYKGWFSRDRVYTIDMRAMNHILTHSYDFPKPPLAR